MTNTKKRVSIKISGKLHRKLVLFREKTGIPISNIIRLAVAKITRGKRGGIIRRPGTKRGSR